MGDLSTTTQIIIWIAMIAVAYALGTFPSAVLVARANGVDITTEGSGNPGASNVARVLGWRRGIWVFVLDAAKGAIPAALGVLLGAGDTASIDGDHLDARRDGPRILLEHEGDGHPVLHTKIRRCE